MAWQLYQFPLCPFSRKVRLLLGEKGEGCELVRESPWEQRDEYIDMNPAGQTPVLVDRAQNLALLDSTAICEYLEETVEKSTMLPGTAANRAEVRRLVAWFDQKFHDEVGRPLLYERMEKRLVHRISPDAKVLREAMRLANSHLDYVDWLLDHRRWIGGPLFSLADLAAAAHISVADYLGGIDWRGHEHTHGSDRAAGPLRQGRLLAAATRDAWRLRRLVWLGSRGSGSAAPGQLSNSNI
jgi:glutathione S-transferase